MQEKHDNLTRRWLEVLPRGPHAILSAILLDLASCTDSEREDLGELFIAFVCGPRVSPDTAQQILASAVSENAPEPKTLDLQNTELMFLAQRQKELRQERERLGRIHEGAIPLIERCRALTVEVEQKTKRVIRLRDALAAAIVGNDLP